MILFLYFNRRAGETIDYFLVGDDGVCGQGETSPENVQDICAEHQCREIHVLIAGEHVTSLRVQLPRGSAKRLAQALPFIVEEQLASPIDDMHLAAIEPRDGQECQVLAVSRETLSNFLHLAEEHRIPVTGIFPDYLAVPRGEAPQSLRIRNRTLVRFPDGNGLALETSVLPADVLEESPQDLSATSFETGFADLTGNTAGNLLTGEFKRESGKPTAWKKPLALGFAASLLLFVGYFLAAGLYFQHQAETRYGEAENLYRSLFPGDNRIVNIRRQMEGHLQSAAADNGDGSFFRYLSGLSAGMSEVPDDSMFPRHLQFDNKAGTLVADIQAKTMADTTRLKEVIAKRELNAEILSVNKNDEGILTRLEVKSR